MAAKAKPRGTRIRRAITGQLSKAAPQEFPRSGQYFVGSDFEQPLLGLSMSRVIGLARPTAQHDTAGSKRAVARGVCRTKDSDHRDAQSRRHMKGAGVSANKQPRTAGERYQFRQGR